MRKFCCSFLLLCFFLATTETVEAREKSAYKAYYEHLNWSLPKEKKLEESDYYLVFLVTARHLDYTDSQQMMRKLVKHATRGKGSDVGHSWVYLKGVRHGKPYIIEGGQSGEVGDVRPLYYEGVINYVRYGYADPTEKQRREPREEVNPIKYLWEDVNDGFFQKGSGGYRPTFAAKVNLTKEQFDQIFDYMHPNNFNYRPYSLVKKQCSSFVADIAEMAGFSLESDVVLHLSQTVKIGRRQLQLWEDPKYSVITFASPDVLEKSLMAAVRDGQAERALRWYKKKGRRVHADFFATNHDPAWERCGKRTEVVREPLAERFRRLMFYMGRGQKTVEALNNTADREQL